MRTADRPVPTIGGDRPPTERWPAALYVGIEKQPVSSYVYDDYTATYDAAPPDFTYDDLTAWPYDRMDLWCQLHGITITSGATDIDVGIESAHVEMTLDNRDGSLSQYDAAGRLVDFFPGRHLDVWAVLDTEAWWLFSGRVTAWRERADGTVEAEAFDAFSDLNRDIGEWDPGHYGDTVPVRLAAICATLGYTGATRYDPGAVTLHSYLTTATPLEEMRAVARSDGGLVGVDADGTLVYRDRTWPVGRADQTAIPTLSDNVCDAPFTVWEAELTTDDDLIANTAVLTNVADVTVTATNQHSIDRYGPLSIPARTDDQWIGADQGAELAELLVARRGEGYVRLEGFDLYLHDPRQDLWAVGIDRRIGDIVTFAHHQPSTTGVELVVLNLLVAQVIHEITPDQWVTTIATTRAVGTVTVLHYDRTAYRYDEPEAVYVL